MAQTKKELLAEAEQLGIKIDPKAKVADIRRVIETHTDAVIEVAPVETIAKEEPVSEATDDKPTAKAGRRSAKALKEAEEKLAKEERKHSSPDKETESKPKIMPKPRSRLERRAKAYRKSAEQIDSTKKYTIGEAVVLAKSTSHVKFDASVELHVNLNVDPKQSDQNVRDNLVLPAGSGKNVNVAVISDDPELAKKAGADIAGNDDLIADIEKGTLSFDVLIATPNQMPKLGKLARILGPRGLMPNPKSGTVTTDIEKAVKEAKGGKVEYRVDSTGIVHLAVGKVSFDADKLTSNIDAVMLSIRSNKPSSVKSNYIKAIHLATSMGPSIKVEIEGAL